MFTFQLPQLSLLLLIHTKKTMIHITTHNWNHQQRNYLRSQGRLCYRNQWKTNEINRKLNVQVKISSSSAAGCSINIESFEKVIRINSKWIWKFQLRTAALTPQNVGWGMDEILTFDKIKNWKGKRGEIKWGKKMK